MQHYTSAAGPNQQLSLASNSFGCLNPADGNSCTIAMGNRYFPYLSQSIESNWDWSGTALPVVTTTNTFDSYGNATAITVGTTDGYSKTTTNTYTNDPTNWYLGRLTRSSVQSTAPDIPANPTPPALPSSFSFNATITADIANYNIKSAALAAGWDQMVPLVATITIYSGVHVYSTSTSTPAFATGTVPSGSSLALINNGFIDGAGGAGGVGGNETTSIGGSGAAGGVALQATAPLSVTNGNGTIQGGGGGGGGEHSMYGETYPYGGGGGGGGQGRNGGVGGVGGYAVHGTGTNGAAGSPSAPGIGGFDVDGGYQAGSGGSWGSPGETIYAPGGAGGAAVVGNNNITWISTGTRLGALQN